MFVYVGGNCYVCVPMCLLKIVHLAINCRPVMSQIQCVSHKITESHFEGSTLIIRTHVTFHTLHMK